MIGGPVQSLVVGFSTIFTSVCFMLTFWHPSDESTMFPAPGTTATRRPPDRSHGKEANCRVYTAAIGAPVPSWCNPNPTGR